MNNLAILYNNKAMLKEVNESLIGFIDDNIIKSVDAGENPAGYGEAKKVLAKWNDALAREFGEKTIQKKPELTEAE